MKHTAHAYVKLNAYFTLCSHQLFLCSFQMHHSVNQNSSISFLPIRVFFFWLFLFSLHQIVGLIDSCISPKFIVIVLYMPHITAILNCWNHIFHTDIDISHRFYQRTHIWPGFMADPTGQLKWWWKSAQFRRGMLARKTPGLCGSLVIWFSSPSFVSAPHHTLAYERKNICSFVNCSRPGKRASWPLVATW